MLEDIIVYIVMIPTALFIGAMMIGAAWSLISGFFKKNKKESERKECSGSDDCIFLTEERKRLQQKYEKMEAQLQKEFDEKEAKRQKEFKAEKQGLYAVVEEELATTESVRKRLLSRLDALPKSDIPIIEPCAPSPQEFFKSLPPELMYFSDKKKEQFLREFSTDKGERAITHKMNFSDFSIACKVYSHNSGDTYKTSLFFCNCKDYAFNVKKDPEYICKHMMALAIKVGAVTVDVGRVLNRK